MSELNNVPAQPGHKASKPSRTIEQELIRRNRPVLLGALRELGLNKVGVEYRGSGDDGGIEATVIQPVGSHDWFDPTEEFERHRITLWWSDAQSWNSSIRGAKVARRTMTLSEAINDFTEELLDLHFGGFENNDGGAGSVVFDVGERQIRIDHEWNVMTTESEQVVL